MAYAFARHSAIALIIAPLACAAAQPAASLRYTAQESQVLDLLDAQATSSTPQQLKALQMLVAQPAFATPRGQAIIAMQQCDLAVRARADPEPYIKRLGEIARQAKDQDLAPAALGVQCQLVRDQLRGTPPSIEQVWRHYRNVQDLALPALQFEVATAYGHLAHSLGLLDEALKAIESALKIAQANEDVAYQRSSLMDLALIQADLGLHTEALRNSAAALAFGQSNNQIALLANRGYVQMRAEQLNAAEVTYKQALALAEQSPGRESSQASAWVNLSAIYARQGRLLQNLEATERALSLASALGPSSHLGYAQLARALALMEAGQADDARPLFQQGFDLLQTAGEHAALSEYLVRWSQQLSKQKLWREAYEATERSRNLNEEIAIDVRRRNGQYLSAMLESSQKDQAIEALRQQGQIAALQAERRKAMTIAWATGSVALTLVLAVLLGFYLRLRKTNARLHHENAHDNLTRLHSRTYLNQHFDLRARQAQGSRAMLALLDIDHFKHINDTYGHAVGDEVLQQVGARLRSALRGADVIARWGGEEIVIFVEELHAKLRAGEVAERLRQALARSPLQVAGEQIEVTASIGFIEFTLVSQSRLDTLLEKVDARLYVAKRLGRNRVVGEEAEAEAKP